MPKSFLELSVKTAKMLLLSSHNMQSMTSYGWIHDAQNSETVSLNLEAPDIC